MLFSLLYFLVCRLLGAGGRRAEERDIELLVLRHQVRVLQGGSCGIVMLIGLVLPVHVARPAPHCRSGLSSR